MTDLLEGTWSAPSDRLLVLRRLECAVVVPLVGLVAGAALLVDVGRTAALLALVATGVALTLSLVSVQRRFRAWGYAEREDDLLVRRGVLVRRTSVVPYGRMQYVDVAAGPLDRRFGLATLVLHTAAVHTDARVPGLPAQEAARLRDRLAALGEARQAGV